MKRICVSLFGILLCSCITQEEKSHSIQDLHGTYLGDHGAITRIRGVESELILNRDGSFRFFQIDSNTAVFTSKGKWKFLGKEMVWNEINRSYLYHGGFRRWDTLAVSDTSYIRNITENGFERLEVSWDSQYVPQVEWIKYRKIPENIGLFEGGYEFREAIQSGLDTTITDSLLTRLEIIVNGSYIEKKFLNGKLTETNVDSQWTQVGSFLITSHNHYCTYEETSSYCGDTQIDFEYVARLRKIKSSSFEFWVAPDFTMGAYPFWAEFRKPELTVLP